ncbi:MAG: hypothetical protein JSS16_10350 [Proteobacteria bacterium]|nr:hypothetical protein [Pseudomonadota bacterium]
MKLGSAPTISSPTCRPHLTGNNESCTVTTADTCYIRLRADATFSGVTLTGTTQ